MTEDTLKQSVGQSKYSANKSSVENFDDSEQDTKRESSRVAFQNKEKDNLVFERTQSYETSAGLTPIRRNSTADNDRKFSYSSEDQYDDYGVYKWICLCLILFISIGNQWQRYTLSYAYGLGNAENNPFIEIKSAYPELVVYYGILSGLAFTASYSICGIFSGILSDNFNRKGIMISACVLWSLCTLLTGLINSFALLFVLRFMQGIFESTFNPCGYSIIADYFHPSKRTTANSIFNLGIYLGNAFSSLSIILIKKYGWRATYELIGIAGIVTAVFGFVLIKEPCRGCFELHRSSRQSYHVPLMKRIWSALFEILSNPTCRYCVIAGSFRYFGGFAIAFYMPTYFGAIYPDYSGQYSIINALIVSICGFTSALSGGILCDYFEKRGYLMTKGVLCVFAGLLGTPFIVICTIYQDNFWVSISSLGMSYLVAECWISPTITMVISTISPENKGLAVSIYLFCVTVAETISTALLGWMLKYFGAQTHKELYGYILCAFVVFSYMGSVPFFYLAARAYKAQMLREQRQSSMR